MALIKIGMEKNALHECQNVYHTLFSKSQPKRCALFINWDNVSDYVFLNFLKVKRLRVRRGNTGESPDWLLEQVTVYDKRKNKRYVFPCISWFRGRDLELEFVPGVKGKCNC